MRLALAMLALGCGSQVTPAGPCVPWDAAAGDVAVPVQLALGDAHGCARWSDGTVRCWGANHHGQLGDGTTTDRVAPTPVVGLGPVVQIAAGGNQTCALVAEGSVWCWGGRLDYAEELVDHGADRAVPTRIGVGTAGRIIVGVDDACVVTCDATPWCWTIFSGITRLDPTGPSPSSQPERLVDLDDVSDVALTLGAVLARSRDGALRTWAGSAAIGRGSGTARPSPVAVAGLTGTRSIAAGGDAFCATTTTGALYCWGEGSVARVAGASTPGPALVAGLGPVEQVALGDERACARLRDGTVSCWGFYLTGFRSACELTTPAPIEGVTDAIDVAVGDGHACALVRSAAGPSIVCWGDDSRGQLGASTVRDRNCPGPIM